MATADATTPPTPRSLDRHLARVGGEPAVEGEQLRVQRAGDLGVAGGEELATQDGLKLEHVGDVFRAGDAGSAEDVERNVVEAHLAPEGPLGRRRHLRTGEVLAGDAEPLADRAGAATEETEGALADVHGGDAWKPGAPERHGEHEVAVRRLARPHAEMDEVVPVEGGEEVGGRRRLLGEDSIHLALGVEVRDLVAALERGQPAVVERYPPARVLEGRPEDVLETGPPARPGQRRRLGALPVRGLGLPEVGDAEGAGRAGKSPVEALRIVEVPGDDLHAEGGEGAAFL